MLPESEKKAQSYVDEEIKSLSSLMSSVTDLKERNFIIVGAGTLWYIDLVYGQVKNYIAIEPLADIFIQKQVNFILSMHQDIAVIDKDFGDFDQRDLPTNSSIFVFHFNILSYLSQPIKKINKYLRKGDILYLSTWNSTPEAKKTRKEYFSFINDGMSPSEFTIDPDKAIGWCNLDAFPFQKLKYYQSHQRIKGLITDILIIRC